MAAPSRDYRAGRSSRNGGGCRGGHERPSPGAATVAVDRLDRRTSPGTVGRPFELTLVLAVSGFLVGAVLSITMLVVATVAAVTLWFVVLGLASALVVGTGWKGLAQPFVLGIAAGYVTTMIAAVAVAIALFDVLSGETMD